MTTVDHADHGQHRHRARRPRRRFSSSVTVLGVGLLIAACGSAVTPAADTGSSTVTAADSSATFPVSLTHKFGTTVVESAPTRVVSVGYTEHDTLLALGVAPVGVTDWYGDQPYATWPWAQDELGDATPEVLSLADGFQFEKIAALQPDVIIGTNAGMEAEDYAIAIRDRADHCAIR